VLGDDTGDGDAREVSGRVRDEDERDDPRPPRLLEVIRERGHHVRQDHRGTDAGHRSQCAERHDVGCEGGRDRGEPEEGRTADERQTAAVPVGEGPGERAHEHAGDRVCRGDEPDGPRSDVELGRDLRDERRDDRA
jgi:hypothetical protein